LVHDAQVGVMHFEINDTRVVLAWPLRIEEDDESYELGRFDSVLVSVLLVPAAVLTVMAAAVVVAAAACIMVLGWPAVTTARLLRKPKT
jgi:hypothetical protein